MSSTSQITDKLLLFVQKLPGRLSVYTLEATNSNFHETSDYNDYVIQEHGTTSIFDKMYKKTENKLLGLGDFFWKGSKSVPFPTFAHSYTLRKEKLWQ